MTEPIVEFPVPDAGDEFPQRPEHAPGIDPDSGCGLAAFLDTHEPDPDWADDLAEIRALLTSRDLLAEEQSPPDD